MDTRSEHVCLYQNSSTLQIIHRVPRNQEKMRSKKHKITRSSFKQVRIERYITPLASSNLTKRSRVWPVNFFIIIIVCACDVIKSKEPLKVLSSSGKGDTKFISVYNFTAHLNFGVMAMRDTKIEFARKYTLIS